MTACLIEPCPRRRYSARRWSPRALIGATFLKRGLPALTLAAVLAPLGAFADTASFTGSRGRTLLYSYEFDESWDREVPRGIYMFFHGNNRGTRADVIARVGTGRTVAKRLGLVPVTVASPHALGDGENHLVSRYDWRSDFGGTRAWHQEDMNLIHELLQTHFDGSFSVDLNRVVLHGASAGTGFLHRFIATYGEHYGGGVLADCGPSWVNWPFQGPSRQMRGRFRVYVSSTLSDFLFDSSINAYGSWKYRVGFETRGNFEHRGYHCETPSRVIDDAIAWLARATRIPDGEEEPHFRTVSSMDRLVGVATTTDGALWVLRQEAPREPAMLWRSVDRGRSFERVSEVSGLDVADFDAVGQALFLTTRSGQLHRSTDGGAHFESVNVVWNSHPTTVTTTDRGGGLYVAVRVLGSLEIYRSDDLGASWVPLGVPPHSYRLVTPLAMATDDPSYLIVEDFEGNISLGSTRGGEWSQVHPPESDDPFGRFQSFAWDGSKLWTRTRSGDRLAGSTTFGSIWETGSGVPDGSRGHAVVAVGHEELLVGGRRSYLRNSAGDWREVLGNDSLRYFSGFIDMFPYAFDLAFDHTRGDIFLTDGYGVYLLDGRYRWQGRADGFADADGDGISDLLDTFPANATEYLDTDLDGIGNHADDDDDGDGVPDDRDGAPLDPFESVDSDQDGVADGLDPDDDNDRVEDLIDPFPLDIRERADSDRDGVGDFDDPDDDNDGVPDREDAWPLHAQEWLDTDGDGIGDNLDRDDDNDGTLDEDDPAPRNGDPQPSLMWVRNTDLFCCPEYTRKYIELDAERPKDASYPPRVGKGRTFYGQLTLGDGPRREVRIMVDYLDEHPRHTRALVHLDRNRNRDLNDDGPPRLFDSRRSETFVVGTIDLHAESSYADGVVVPYRLAVRVRSVGPRAGLTVVEGGAWLGRIAAGKRRVLTMTVDNDIDGLFDGDEDFVCIDVNEDHDLSCEESDSAERFQSGDRFAFHDGQQAQVFVAKSGHQVEICQPHCPPRPTGAIPRVELASGGDSVPVDLSGLFVAGDGGPLTYTAHASNAALVRLIVKGNTLTIVSTEQAEPGKVVVTVTGTDASGQSATVTFEVTIEGTLPAPRGWRWILIRQAMEAGDSQLDGSPASR